MSISVNLNPYFAVGFENRNAKVASFYAQKSPSIPTAVCKEFFGDKNKQILRRIPKSTAKNGLKYQVLILFIFFACLFIFSETILFCQQMDLGVGMDFTPGPGEKEKKEKKEPPENEFISKIATKFNQDNKKLQKLHKQGFGRIELIKLMLISQKANIEFEEIMKLRKRKEKLFEIAQKYNLNYKEIKEEATRIKKEIIQPNH